MTDFDVFEHTPQAEAVQPVLEFDGYNMLKAVDIDPQDRVSVIRTNREGKVLGFIPIGGRMKARVILDCGAVRHYEKSELRKV